MDPINVNKMSRRSCVDEVFNRFKEFVQGVLRDVPEARTLMLTVDWEIGSNDFPPASMLGRNGTSLSIDELMGCMKQTSKLVAHQSEVLRRMIGAAEKAATDLQDKVNKLARQAAAATPELTDEKNKSPG